MIGCIGIRRETKDKTQQRVPLSPEQAGRLHSDQGLRVLVEPMEKRIFHDGEYAAFGAELTSDLRESNVVFGVKEIQQEFMIDGMAYCFFSHTIKAQSYNMPMLRYILDHGITLVDYELIKHPDGRRAVFFGNFAGYAGMIDSMWALGRRLAAEGLETPFHAMRYATDYGTVEAAEAAFARIGGQIAEHGLPAELQPFVCGFTGYGNVSKGAQHLYDLLPVQRIAPGDLASFMERGEYDGHHVYKVEFREEDMFEPNDAQATFQLQDFYDHPERYRSRFDRYLPHLSMMINGIYWEPRYPRLVTIESMRALYTEGNRRLRVIGDVTCDIDGSVQLTVKETNSENPVFVYEPLGGVVRDGVDGDGPVVLAVDKLPTELPREASAAFGASLEPFVPALAMADYGRPLDGIALPEMLRHAIIAHRGSLAPAFRYLEEHLPG
jgi:alpha-aminoadipic semialdehyde synthase